MYAGIPSPKAYFSEELLAKLENAHGKYIIRPAQPEDHDSIRSIFIEGMMDYSPTGGNYRNLFPHLDEEHFNTLMRGERDWTSGFEGYATREAESKCLTDINNYWSLQRRAVMLVAIEKLTGACVGTIAIHAGELINGDKYQENYAYLMNSIKNTHTATQKYNYRDFIIFCQFAAGNLPSEYYLLDDPLYDPQTYIPGQYVCVLPSPSIPVFSPQTPEEVPNYFTKQDLACNCRKSKCKSKKAVVKFSKLSPERSLAAFASLSDADVEELFCSCIRSAMDEVVATSPSSKPNLCSYCIKDAAYLIQPVLIENDGNTSETQRFIVNPKLFAYPNIISDQYKDSVAQNNLELAYNTVNQFNNYKITPHGYYRRFKTIWDPISSKSYHSNFIPHPLLSSTNDLGVTTIATVPIDTYDKFVSHVKSHLPNISSPASNSEENYNWITHYTIPESYNNDPLLTADNLYSCCELKRMSVTRAHRSSGIGPLLLLSMIYFARYVLKYDILHLSTAYVMDMACQFYRKMGMHEELPNWEPFHGAFAIAHFTSILTRHGQKYNYRAFEVTKVWPDVPIKRVKLKYTDKSAYIADDVDNPFPANDAFKSFENPSAIAPVE